MEWLDVAGPPGSGKSTLCDPLWGPHDLPIEDNLPPFVWHDFINEITRLLLIIQDHPTIEAAVRMNKRSLMKMATVARLPLERVYVQTGFVQRGLGFGWRLVHMGKSLNELQRFFDLMPVSKGVVFTQCPRDEVIRRNHLREQNPQTAHENRAFMYDLMLPAIAYVQDALVARGVPVHVISTNQDIENARNEVVHIASQKVSDPGPSGHLYQTEIVSSPAWWHGFSGCRPRLQVDDYRARQAQVGSWPPHGWLEVPR